MVVPEGVRGQELRRRVTRLIDHRAAQQKIRPEEVQVFPVAPAMTWQETEEFRCKLLKLAPEDQPRYLLILGDAHEVSFDFQQYLAVDRFVGRLTFPRDIDFEHYVDKVLKAEQNPPRAKRGRTLFFASHDGTDATRHGYERLVCRSLEACEKSHLRGAFPASEVLEVDTAPTVSSEELLASAARPEPTALLSLSHGSAGPMDGWHSAQEQRLHQGELVLANGQLLTASDVSHRPFLPGGIWIYFACFSVGTPARSAYAPWLQRLRELREGGRQLEAVLSTAPLDGQPFVSALPQAALANPHGPLAVIGHVDLAWSYTYHDVEGNNRSERFTDVLRSLMKRRRAGVGLHSLTNSIASIDTRLSMLYHQDEVARAGGCEPTQELLDRAYWWMARHDLSTYVLLGDPAARLSIEPQER
ncbi:hypothetical protein D7V88_12895 [Corallococcus terminator]|uniref:Gingipain domain-containing protein n=1 Tax=Corallococcus terminator TaxID=2316733 RepID=A0A3A8J0R6_9BACT|nr:hypothetical protein D7V88_12895 [Corallococcus terminator]